MITNIGCKIKYFCQISYDNFIDSINFHKLTCFCGKSGNLIKHAYYKRTIKTPDGPIRIRILRVKCKCCERTHAIFPEEIVPYSQILLGDHLNIINAYNNKTPFEPIMKNNIYIDESNIRHIISQYLKHWKERIASFTIALDFNLSFNCLCTFKRQFMQIKCTPNIIFI